MLENRAFQSLVVVSSTDCEASGCGLAALLRWWLMRHDEDAGRFVVTPFPHSNRFTQELFIFYFLTPTGALLLEPVHNTGSDKAMPPKMKDTGS